MKTVKYGKDEIIFKEGEFGKAMYEIISGKVGIVSSYGTPEEKILTQLKRGDIFGEMALIDIYPRSTTAVADSEVECLEIPSEMFSEYFKNRPSKILEIMKHISGRVRALTADYIDVCNTINESSGAKGKENRPEGLMAKLKKFAGIYSKNEKAILKYEEKKARNPQDDGIAGILKFYKANEIVFMEGEEGKCMFDIHKGSVGIYANYGKPEQKKIAEVLAGEFFGEMGMIDHEARSATAVALEDTSLEAIYQDNLEGMFQDKPAKVLLILQHLTHRLRKLTVDYMRACKTASEILKAQEEESQLEPETSEWIKFFCEVSLYGRYYT